MRRLHCSTPHRETRVTSSRRKGKMKSKHRVAVAAFAMALAFALCADANAAPAAHPAYLRALSDLRDARAHLERPDGGQLHQQEKDAIAEIDRAIGEIKAASIDDGKNLGDH